MRRLRRFLALASSDRRLLFRAALWLGLVRAGLWVLPFQNLLDRLMRQGPGRESSLPGPANANRIGWAVHAASRYVPGTRSCLPRALAATALLRGAGLPARLRLGVTKGEGGRTEAHAWVESGGRVIVGAEELERYVPISVMKGVVE